MDELNISMLGGFKISYLDSEVALGRNTTAKFIQLLQLIWLCKEEGVTKDRLLHTLYEGEERANVNNSMNNLIYQMRLQMVRAGLPKYDYIVKRSGSYFPDPKLRLVLDVDDFIANIKKAEASEYDADRHVFYRRAVDLYKGDLLPELRTEIWVISRSVDLQNMYEDAVEWLGAYYSEKGSFDDMLLIYHKASEIYPDRSWQVGEIEALIGKGSYKEAYKLYDKTVRYYEQELGISASPRLLNCYQLMKGKDGVEIEPDRIDEIRGSLLENRKVVEEDMLAGAYDCSYPSFIDAYHILSRNMARTGESVYMMLCTLVDYEGKIIRNEEKRNDMSETLYKAIASALRQGDVYCKYNASQYLILLSGTSREDCEIVYRRIGNKLKDFGGGRAEIRYSVVSLADLEKPEYRS